MPQKVISACQVVLHINSSILTWTKKRKALQRPLEYILQGPKQKRDILQWQKTLLNLIIISYKNLKITIDEKN